MSNDDDEVVFVFGEEFELQYLKNFFVQAGDNTYVLTSEADFDFVHVIAGSGTLSQPDQVDALEPGRKVKVSRNVSYVLQSAPKEDLSVEILGVRNKD